VNKQNPHSISILGISLKNPPVTNSTEFNPALKADGLSASQEIA
jgi:hypothetical protein